MPHVDGGCDGFVIRETDLLLLVLLMLLCVIFFIVIIIDDVQDGLEEWELEPRGPDAGVVGVLLVEDVVVDDGLVLVAERVELVAVRCVTRVQPRLQLVVDLLDTVLHLLTDHVVGLTCKQI